MVVKARVAVSWSTGKDSAWCLHRLRGDDAVEIVGLLTTVTPQFGRVSVHGTRVELLRAQGHALELPVCEVEIPYPCTNEEYEAAMADALDGIGDDWSATHVAFGDLFLEDVRAYREDRMRESDLEPLFPLWGLDTYDLAHEMLDGGVQAIIVSAPESSPAASFVGQPWSAETLQQVPAGVDPCGERGEFHTCIVAGAGLDPLAHEIGVVVHRDGSVYADIALVAS